MVINEGKVIVIGMLMAVFLVVANSAYFLIKTDDSTGLMSGNSIKEVVSGFYQTSSVNQRIFILFQFFLLILIVVVILIIIKKFKSKTRLSKNDFVKKGQVGSKTDIDILYEMLKRDKVVGISDVSRIFGVAPEVSLGWAKVLEDGNLARIEYPRFGKPVLRLSEGEDSEEEGAGKKMEGKAPMEERKKKGLQKVVPEKEVMGKVVLKKVAKKPESKKLEKIGAVKVVPTKIARKIEKKKMKVEKKMMKVEKKMMKKDKKRSAKKIDEELRKIDEEMKNISKRVKRGNKKVSKHSKKLKK